jgi:hypothetical protein
MYRQISAAFIIYHLSFIIFFHHHPFIVAPEIRNHKSMKGKYNVSFCRFYVVFLTNFAFISFGYADNPYILIVELM